jgi:HK97 family phage major capsid protein
MEKERKTLDDVIIPNATDVEKIEQISKRIAEDVVKKELDEINKSIAEIPTEPFRSSENKEDPIVQEGRNIIKGIIYNRPELFSERYKSFLNETTGSAGGYLVPQEWYKQILKFVTESGVVRKNATVINMSRKELAIPKLDRLPSFTFVSEGSMKPVSNPTFAQVVLSRKDGGFIVIFSKQLIDDEAFDIMGFVSRLAAQIISRTEDLAGFKGITDKIDGLFTNGSGATVVEVNGASFTNLKYDDIINMISSVPSETLGKAKWYMHRTIYGMLKSMKYDSSQEYIITPDDRKSNMLEGFPVVLTDQSYALSEDLANRAFIAFGDLQYMILGTRNTLSIDYSKDATVDMGGGQTVNLWQNGLVGLNFGASFDIKFSYPSALAIAKTREG